MISVMKSILLAILCYSSSVFSATYIVSESADASVGEGSLAKPFKTIQKAADTMQAGDTCLIRSGIYRETVIPAASGTSGKPIVFKQYGTDTVFISAADPITGWTKDAGNVWKTPVSWNIGLGRNQVFVNGEAMIEARIPNLDQIKNTPADGNVIHHGNTTDFPPSIINPAVIPGSSQKGAGVLKIWIGTPDDGYGKSKLVPFFDSCRTNNVPQNFLAGALVHKTAGYWSSEVGVGAPGWGVEPANAPAMAGWMYAYVNASNWEAGGGNFAFIGKKMFLDVQKEWALENGTLFLRTPSDKDPNVLLIELKKRILIFDLSNRDFIEISGIHSLGGSFNLNTTNNCIINDCHARNITHWTIPPNFTTDRTSGASAIYIYGNNNKILNSSIEYSAASGIFIVGNGNIVDNCLVHDCDYLGTYEVGIATGAQVEGHNTVSHTTLYNFGRSALTYSTAVQGSLKTGQKWTYNNVYNCMFLADDGGSIYTNGQQGAGTEISYNWFHDMVQWWNTHHIYFDYGGDNCIIHHNVFWQYKGNAENNPITTAPMAQITYNNTSIDSIRSDVYKGYNDDERGVNALWADGKPGEWGIKDAKNFDFTLVAGSKAIDKGGFRADSQFQFLKNFLNNGYTFKLDTPVVIPQSDITGAKPDLGAYEYGKPRWVPGHTWGEVVWNYPMRSVVGITTPLKATIHAIPQCQRIKNAISITLADGADFTVTVLNLSGRTVALRNSKNHQKTLLFSAHELPSALLLVRVSTIKITKTFTINMVR